jgi:hypothetical protein
MSINILQTPRSTAKTTSKELAKKIWKRRKGEIAMGLFKVG